MHEMSLETYFHTEYSLMKIMIGVRSSTHATSAIEAGLQEIVSHKGEAERNANEDEQPCGRHTPPFASGDDTQPQQNDAKTNTPRMRLVGLPTRL